MSLLQYPSTLPGPIALSQQRAERRALTGLPGPRAVRALWRDRLDPSVPITFRFRTPEQAAQFVEWLHTDQLDAGAWFAADWRVPQGGGGIFRFLQLPAFPQWLAPNVWECSGTVEIRGRSLPVELFLCYDEDFDLSAYTLEGTDIWSVDVGPYGRTLEVASISAAGVRSILRAIDGGQRGAASFKFKIGADHFDDCAVISWFAGSSAIFFNPYPTNFEQPARRPILGFSGSASIVVGPTLVAGVWYEIEIQSGSPSTAVLKDLTTGTVLQTTDCGNHSVFVAEGLRFQSDSTAQTTGVAYADLHLC